MMLSLGHGFIETLSARLRDPAGTEWSSSESWLLGPTIARQLRRPVALFREDGTLEWAAAEDGTELSAAPLPPTALRLQRHEGSYVVLGPVRLLRKFPTLLFAAAEANRAPGSMEPSTGVEREIAFRKALADAIDVRSTRLELERVHQLWIQRMGLPPRELQLLIALSRLRHAIFHGDPLTAAQQQRLRAAGGAELRAAIDANARNWRELAKGVLAKLFDEESALLPTGLGHLLVQDAAILSSARYQASDQWTEGGRHYVRLRHLDGRTQVVETAAEQGDQRGAYREILVPTASANRETGRYVVDRGGMWYPEPELRDGLAPVDPREYAETLASVAARWHAVTRDDFSLGKRIVDSIPQPLLRYFAAPLTAVDMGDDTGFLLTIRHPGSGSLKRFMTRVDMAGNALPPVRPVDAGPAPSGAIAADTQLALPVPEGVGIVRFGPRPDPAIFIDLLRADSPISAFIEAGIGNRHIRTLVTTRRLRGMLREDSHLAIVGATPEHAFTLLMPVNTETISLVRPGGSMGNLVTDLPAGTVIVDEMFGVRATAADYPARVRAVARQWESAGGRIRKVLRNGSEERESPVAFVERMLSSPVRPNLWNPSKDPISETAYVDYMRGRHANGQAVRHAGLDWLETRQARRDYMAYFAPPHDALPDGTAPPANDLAASNMYELAETAIDASLRPIAVPARPPAPRP
ncbi:hypothetical protein ACQKIE_12485 [Luteibacter sp. NPDC031894]|uniref:hypothetical protein n=1 Tax=Luteibacter sp. NPDC031894 TaxID=3390572 RepID=UPI003CFFC670